MAIGIKGIRVDSVQVARGEDGQQAITASYSLISTADKVLAKQAIGGYNGMTIQPSAQTIGALDAFLKLYVADVNTVLGLTE